MGILVSFSGAARNFFGEIDGTRRSLARTATMLKTDARQARSWGFFAIGWLGQQLLDRSRDTAAAREGNLRGYAERVVWMTHFLDDAGQIAAVKADVLDGNAEHITVEELDAYLREHVDDLPFHGATDAQRTRMIADVHRRHGTTELAMPGVEIT